MVAAADPWLEPEGEVFVLERLTPEVVTAIRCFEVDHPLCQGGCRTGMDALANMGLVNRRWEPTKRFRQALAMHGDYDPGRVLGALDEGFAPMDADAKVRFINAVDQLRVLQARRGDAEAGSASTSGANTQGGASSAASAAENPGGLRDVRSVLTAARLAEPPGGPNDAMGPALERSLRRLELGKDLEAARNGRSMYEPMSFVAPAPAGGSGGITTGGPTTGGVGQQGENSPPGAPGLAGTGNGVQPTPEARAAATAAQNGDPAGGNAGDHAAAGRQRANGGGGGAGGGGGGGGGGSEPDSSDSDSSDDESEDEDEEGIPLEVKLQRRAARKRRDRRRKRQMREAIAELARMTTRGVEVNQRDRAGERGVVRAALQKQEDVSRNVQESLEIQTRFLEMGKLSTINFGWKFSGKELTNNPEHAPLPEFLRQIDSICDSKGADPKMRIELCRANLRGDALNWFMATSANEKGRSLAFISDWEKCKRYMREQYSRSGACYYINMRDLYKQKPQEDAEQFYCRVSLLMDGFLERYGQELFAMCLPRQHGLLLPGANLAPDSVRYDQFAWPVLMETAGVQGVVDAIAHEGWNAALRAALMRALGELCHAYVKEFIRMSYSGFCVFMKESRAWFEMVDGLRGQETRKYAGNLMRANFAKPKHERMDARNFWVRIKNKELLDAGQTDRAIPPGPGAIGGVGGDMETDDDVDSGCDGDAAAAKGQKKPKKPKKGGKPGGGKKGGGGGGGGAGGKRGNGGNGGPAAKKVKAHAADGDDGSRGEGRKVCPYCKKPGHDVSNCWTKHPEQKPEWLRAGAVTGSGPDGTGEHGELGWAGRDLRFSYPWPQ